MRGASYRAAAADHAASLLRVGAFELAWLGVRRWERRGHWVGATPVRQKALNLKVGRGYGFVTSGGTLPGAN